MGSNIWQIGCKRRSKKLFVTKFYTRRVLSFAFSVFDLVGLVAPYTVIARIRLKEVGG